MFIASLNNSSDQTWKLAHGRRGVGDGEAGALIAYIRNRVWYIGHQEDKTGSGGCKPPVIPALEKLRQEDCLESEASLGYAMSSSEASAFLDRLLSPAHLGCVILYGHEVQECGVHWIWPSHHCHQLLFKPGVRAPKAQYFSNLGILCSENQG